MLAHAGLKRIGQHDGLDFLRAGVRTGSALLLTVKIKEIILIRVASVGARDRHVGISVFGRLGKECFERLCRVQPELLHIASVLAGMDAVSQIFGYIVAGQQMRLVDQPQVLLVARRNVGQIRRHIDAVLLTYALCVGFFCVLRRFRRRLRRGFADIGGRRQAFGSRAALAGRFAAGCAAGFRRG